MISLVDRADDDVAQQIGVDLVTGHWPTEAPLGVHRSQAENGHQALNTLAIDPERHSAPQQRHPATAAVIRPARVVLVEQPQEQQILLAREDRRVIIARPRQAGQLALPRNAQIRMAGIDPLSSFANREIQTFF